MRLFPAFRVEFWYFGYITGQLNYNVATSCIVLSKILHHSEVEARNDVIKNRLTIYIQAVNTRAIAISEPSINNYKENTDV